LFETASERRSFHYFQTHACHSLGGPFNSSFWARGVLLAAIHYRPIRHLVIALGAASEALETGGENGGIGGMELALQQCNQSIRQLAALSQPGAHPSGIQSAETVYNMLTASLLFVYFACVRGRIPEAIRHVLHAVKILHEADRRQANQTFERTNGANYPVPVSQLRQLLISVYGQLRSIINDITPEEGTRDLLVSELKPATIFLSLPEAHAYVESLSHNTLAFLQDIERRPPSTTERLGEVVKRHRELCQALESSRQALDAFSVSLGTLETPDLNQTRKGIAVLHLHQVMLSVRLRIDFLRPEQRESAFDELEAYLEGMLGYCEFLVEQDRTKRESTAPLQPSCSSGLGVVAPLYMVSVRCRNPQIRRRALQLLSVCHRRDGIWDAALAGRIAAQAQELEEGSGHNRAPDEERVREVKIDFQGDNSASLQFVTVGDWKRRQHGMERVVEWQTAL
jgi:hypothetical protein